MDQSNNNVERLYLQLRSMAADFHFKPEERINESAVSARLGASRTPLREALNRLVAEGFLTFQSGKGFFCRPLSSKSILDLYEARLAVETEALRGSIARASDEALETLRLYLDRIEPDYMSCSDTLALLEMDEAFHLRLARLAENPVLSGMLDTIHGKIRLVRMMDLRALPAGAPDRMSAHRAILDGVIARDEPRAVEALRAHIHLRQEQASDAVRRAFGELYAKDG